MRKYWITIGRKGQPPRIAMEVMAPDSVTAVAQHLDLARKDEHERVEVREVPSEDDFEQADLHYLRNRQARERARLSELTQWEIACARVQGVCS